MDVFKTSDKVRIFAELTEQSIYWECHRYMGFIDSHESIYKNVIQKAHQYHAEPGKA